MSETFQEKQQKIKDTFSGCKTSEEKYEKIIELGRQQKAIDPKLKTEEHIVSGCQSKMYLHSYMENGRMFFETESDALISAGLGVLLTQVYSGETPETLLKCPPDYIKEIGLDTSLSPGRSNGLASLHLKMKQDSLSFVNK